MSKPDAKRDLEALIKVTEENREELKKTQQKMETLEAAIRALRNTKLESEQMREKNSKYLICASQTFLSKTTRPSNT
jgi:3-methyladenine DNA glycosylase/8-oxoguanine DNA glycosylase